MANLRYTRTIGQTGKDNFEAQIEITMDTDSEVEPNLDVMNSFLTAITGERSTFADSLLDGWIAVDETEE